MKILPKVGNFHYKGKTYVPGDILEVEENAFVNYIMESVEPTAHAEFTVITTSDSKIAETIEEPTAKPEIPEYLQEVPEEELKPKPRRKRKT